MRAKLVVATILVLLPVSRCLAAPKTPEPELFLYDTADKTIKATVLKNPRFYDAGTACSDDGLWMTWLEFVPDKGDQIWIGLRRDNEWIVKERVTAEVGCYANPTVTVDADGGLWLSYEAEVNGQWDVFLRSRLADGKFSSPRRVSTRPGSDINHRTAADLQGGLWLVWQSDRGGQFDVVARRAYSTGLGHQLVASDCFLGDWSPDVAVSADGAVHVVWDSYDGESYNVQMRSRRQRQWGDVVAVTQSPAFEGRAQIACDSARRVWLLWEEGSENWGKEYRSRRNIEYHGYQEISDVQGPLHRFRRLRLGVLDANGSARRITESPPMPSMDAALKRADAPEGIRAMGAFYERGHLAVDAKDRVWVLYRHYYAPWMGVEDHHHVESEWGLYARYLGESGWSDLFRFDVGQRDGTQRLSVAPSADGIAACWTTGRTDRRENDDPRGVAFASIKSDGGPPAKELSTLDSPLSRLKSVTQGKTPPVAAEVGGRRYELLFGDLHRHTDLSLCFLLMDGTIDDAYRYAIDAADLDFMAVTDHTRDIAQGDALTLLWWRCRKEVGRHHLLDTFIPFFGYERSRAETDHNVISLRDDVLRPYTYPHPEFWQELDENTITIPHQPFRSAATWEHEDDEHRPLLEIYQGFRDRSMESDAEKGLQRGHRLGIIASSDHLSTSASYACVWSEERSREAIFHAMKQRRTYGATARIMLAVRAGSHWMGEEFSASAFPAVEIKAKGTGRIESIDIFIDGRLHESLPQTDSEVELTYKPDVQLDGTHSVYVRLVQADGNRAWSSPMWITVTP